MIFSFVLLSFIIITFFILLFFKLISKVTNFKIINKITKENKKNKNLIKKLNEILRINPNNTEALQVLSKYYYEKKDYQNSIKYSKKLCQLIEENKEIENIDIFQAFLTYGVCNLYREFKKDALEYLKKAYVLNKTNEDVNFYLGIALYKNKKYKEALAYLTIIYKFNKSNLEALKYIALSLFYLENYKKTISILSTITEYIENDTESLLIYAKSLSKINKDDLALKIAKQLREKNNMIYESYLIEFDIHVKNENIDQAQNDIKEIIKIKPDISKKIFLNLFYNLGKLYMNSENYKKAIEAFKQIEKIDPEYKKTKEKIEYSRKLNDNIALKVYLRSSKEDFAKLANEFIIKLYKNKFQIRESKINEINSQFIDMNFLIANNQWEENLIVRFVRTEQEIVGELFLKDLISKIKENKAKGLCIAPAIFSEKSKQMIEGRLIDLVEEKKLIQTLNKIDINSFF